MRNIWFGWLVLALAPLGFAQHSLTITASRSTTLQPDQVVFGVSVNSSLTAGLDDVLAALQRSGLTAANLSSVYTQTAYLGSQAQQVLQWTFTLPISFSQMKDTLTSLVNLQKTIGQKNNGMTLTFYLQGTQVSAQLQQSQQCPILDLLGDARAQAQKFADAAGFFLGGVTAMSTGGSGGGANPIAGVARLLTGDISGVTGVPIFTPIVNFIPTISLTSGQNYCSLVVEFRLN